MDTCNRHWTGSSMQGTSWSILRILVSPFDSNGAYSVEDTMSYKMDMNLRSGLSGILREHFVKCIVLMSVFTQVI